MPKLFGGYPMTTTVADLDVVPVGMGEPPTIHNILVRDLATVLASPPFSAENKDSVTFVIGNVLAAHPSGTGVVLASAADNTKHAIGLAGTGVAVGVAESVQPSGFFTRTDWTAIIGTTLLSAMATYFLSATAGKLTTSAPVTVGQVVQIVGKAVSPNTLELLLGDAILL